MGKLVHGMEIIGWRTSRQSREETERSTSSSALSRGPISGTVRLKYVHFLINPCVGQRRQHGVGSQL